MLRVTGFRAGHVGVEVLEPEGQLTGIEALRAAVEPRSFELLDEALETLDLAETLPKARPGRRNDGAERWRRRRISHVTKGVT